MQVTITVLEILVFEGRSVLCVTGKEGVKSVQRVCMNLQCQIRPVNVSKIN